MYPGPSDPDLGVFVKQVADELERNGNAVARVVIDHRGGSPAKYWKLVRPRSRIDCDVSDPFSYTLRNVWCIGSYGNIIARTVIVPGIDGGFGDAHENRTFNDWRAATISGAWEGRQVTERPSASI